MTEKKSEMVRLDSHQNDNWSNSNIPVAILNTESTLHDRISFCWNLANQLHVLSSLLAEHENREIKETAAMFGGQLIPLEAMLRKLGDDTQPSGGLKPLNDEESLTRASEP